MTHPVDLPLAYLHFLPLTYSLDLLLTYSLALLLLTHPLDLVDNIEWENVVHQKATANPASAYIVDREAKDALQLYTGLDEQGEKTRTHTPDPPHSHILLMYHSHFF